MHAWMLKPTGPAEELPPSVMAVSHDFLACDKPSTTCVDRRIAPGKFYLTPLIALASSSFFSTVAATFISVS
jgi:hypothetical protein